MSNATNSGDRMATRGDAKAKMSKVMAMVCSGGLEEDLCQENGKAAKKSGKAAKKSGKAAKKVSKKVPVSKLAELKDASMRKAEAARSSRPRRLTDENGGRNNQMFKTPDAKKNINTSVVTWVHGISPPNSLPPKKQKAASAKPSTVISKVTSTKAKTTSAKSASCAVLSTSTTNVLAKPARRAKCRHEELEPPSDSKSDGEVEGGVLGGLDDDYNDAMEQAAVEQQYAQLTGMEFSPLTAAALSPMKASAAAQRNKNSLDIRTGIASPTRTKKPKKRGNGELPNGALDSGRWSTVFIPTFLRYLGSMEKDIWAFKRHNTVHMLQAIWNTVYAGSTDRGTPRVKHMVEIGGAVHEVSIQQATEW
ncbi:hypothetical protein EDB92DRAFT_1944016 [Lactarius akahatsu]|uniref:Uncharacterized protein n=1 Tax=Lactarius akahatsu TaxID=416441 RepID=A0AAD4Q9D1_9AGAM|nr:hypothetical protein EDB92DRAFT_1944016 [Lactarius akahatsu]